MFNFIQQNKREIIVVVKLFIISFFIQSCKAQKKETVVLEKPEVSIEDIQQVSVSSKLKENFNSTSLNALDFRVPAKKVMPGVVHIISTYKGKSISVDRLEIPDFFKDFFGDDFEHFFDNPNQNPNQNPRSRMGSGSGIIITDDGYVLTNNHVIKNADEIEIVLNDNQSFKGKVVGTDSATDLALLKFEAENLKFILLGDSDSLEVGEWVLAVGNPFNLSTTVTAGIVSAKARNINIIRDHASIESFIQTDAAVNPGNSGGALVNLKGELIGINTAIASPTGAYAGYSFAIPVNIAKKVIDDLLNYGEVQRAYLGVYMRNLNSDLMEELDLKSTQGVYVDSIVEHSAAEEFGVRKKDVIIKVDKEKIESSPRLQEVIGRYHPGDTVTIVLIRKGKERTIEVILKGSSFEGVVSKEKREKVLNSLGITVENLSEKERVKVKIEGGVKVTNIFPGLVKKYTEIKKGFVISKLNNEVIKSVNHFVDILENTKGGVLLEGFYLEDFNEVHYYAFGLE